MRYREFDRTAGSTGRPRIIYQFPVTLACAPADELFTFEFCAVPAVAIPFDRLPVIL